MADVVRVREVASRVCRDQDVRTVFPDHPDDFTTQRDGRFEVAVGEVEELDRFQAEDTSCICLLLFANLAELSSRERSILSPLRSVRAHDVDDLPTQSTPLCDSARTSPIGIVGVRKDDHRSGMLFLLGRDGLGFGGHGFN